MAASKSLIVVSDIEPIQQIVVDPGRLMAALRRIGGSTAQLRPCERDPHAVGARRVRRIAEDAGALIVPADGIAATEDGEWTERLESSGAVAQSSVGLMLAAHHRRG